MWDIEYKRKLMDPPDALRCVESGMRVYIHPGCAEPELLVEALMGRAPYVRDVEIVHLMTMGHAPYSTPEMAGHFRHNAMFIGGNVREAVNDGRADYTPVFLSSQTTWYGIRHAWAHSPRFAERPPSASLVRH